MAKRTSATKGVVSEHRCGECALGEWIDKFSNLDIKGKPIALRCPHSDVARLRGERACGKFVGIRN